MTNHDKAPRFGDQNNSDDDKDSSPPPPLSEKSVNFLLTPRQENVPAKQPAIIEFLLGKDKAAENDKESDPEEESGNKKSSKKKFRRSFGTLFKRIVSRDNAAVRTTPDVGAAPEPTTVVESTARGSIAEAEESALTKSHEEPLNPPEAPESAPEEDNTRAIEDDAEYSAEASTDNTQEVPAPPLAAPAGGNQPPKTPNTVPLPPAGPPPPPRQPASSGAVLTPPVMAANSNPNALPSATSNATIERRGGAAGPLVAFLAANYLSKRRDRKIQRGVRKLDDNLQTAREETDAERRKNSIKEQASREREAEQTQRIGRLENTPAPVSEKQPESPSRTEAEPIKPAVPIAEVLAAGAVAREIASRPSEAPKSSETFPPANESKASAEKRFTPAPIPSRYEQQRREEKVALEARERDESRRQIETTDGEEATQERFFDRRHEVKDDPGAAGLPSMSLSSSRQQSASQPPADQHSQYLQSVQQRLQSQASSPSQPTQINDDIYKQSMRTGFLVGLVVVVLAILALLIS